MLEWPARLRGTTSRTGGGGVVRHGVPYARTGQECLCTGHDCGGPEPVLWCREHGGEATPALEWHAGGGLRCAQLARGGAAVTPSISPTLSHVGSGVPSPPTAGMTTTRRWTSFVASPTSSDKRSPGRSRRIPRGGPGPGRLRSTPRSSVPTTPLGSTSPPCVSGRPGDPKGNGLPPHRPGPTALGVTPSRGVAWHGDGVGGAVEHPDVRGAGPRRAMVPWRWDPPRLHPTRGRRPRTTDSSGQHRTSRNALTAPHPGGSGGRQGRPPPGRDRDHERSLPNTAPAACLPPPVGEVVSGGPGPAPEPCRATTRRARRRHHPVPCAEKESRPTGHLEAPARTAHGEAARSARRPHHRPLTSPASLVSTRSRSSPRAARPPFPGWS